MSELEIYEPGQFSLPELAGIANREHALAAQAFGSVLEHVFAAGDALNEVKKQLRHGEWLPWLEENFDGTRSTAANYMRVAANVERVAHLDEPSLRKALEAVRSENGRSERDRAIRERRASQLALARVQIAADPEACRTEVGDVGTWRPSGVHVIITDPPYVTDDAVELHRSLGDFAVDVLPDGGALVVLTWQPLLPDVLRVLSRPELVYRWTGAWLYETSARTPERRPRVFDGWKPIVVYHRGYIPDGATYFYDVVRSPDADKEHHEWGQSPEGFMQLVRAFSEPGETVCDPFLGAGTTAVAALSEARRFVGCDIDEVAIAKTRERLAA